MSSLLFRFSSSFRIAIIQGLNALVLFGLFLVVVLSWAPEASAAKKINTAYLSFTAPDGWECRREDAFAYSCRPATKQKFQDAIVIVSAKEAGPEDNFTSFEKYLKVPRTIRVTGTTPKISKVQYVRTIKIHNQPWADGAHLNSEIDGYFTRYLATVKERLSILVTLSAAQSRWKGFQKDFATIVNSLKVTSNPTILAQPYSLGKGQAGQGQLPVGGPQVGPGPAGQAVPSKGPNYTLMILAAVAVIGLFLYAFKK